MKKDIFYYKIHGELNFFITIVRTHYMVTVVLNTMVQCIELSYSVRHEYIRIGRFGKYCGESICFLFGVTKRNVILKNGLIVHG